ncbi:MAG: alpha/beta hydrolase [Acidisphaera sp.]|nr:alpha/beta hydrolase [Acidisphaera sp.]
MATDPDAQAVLDLVRLAGRPPYETLSPAEARQLYRESRAVLSPDPPEVALVRALAAPGPGGSIPLRLYRGAGTPAGAALPALIFFHGGGWVIGDLDTHDGVCRRLANEAGCAVVAVDYRLGPEHKFPAAVEDAMAATVWVAEQAGALDIDATRLAVGGDSAGGNLAAVVCLMARDRAGSSLQPPPLRLQLLIYPALDFAMAHPSHTTYGEGHLLTASSIRWFRDQYLRSPADIADWRASPLRAPDLSRLPPAYVITAGCDPLCDEGAEYAQRLERAGNAVAHVRLSGQIHGFITMGRLIAAAGTATADAAAALREAFAPE